MPTALKEWAIVCDCLAEGQQSILLRKGGIRELRDGFTLEHREFFFYPTAFHQNPEQLIPQAQKRLVNLPQTEAGIVPIKLFARVAASWRSESLEKLKQLDDLHILAWSTVEDRFHYRGKPWLEVILVRVFRLPDVLLIPERPEHSGCKSWVPLAMDIPSSGGVPVLDEQTFTALYNRLTVLLETASVRSIT